MNTMLMRKKVYFIAILGIYTLGSCTYNNEEDLYGKLVCDTANVSYLTHIKPIVEQHCISCHGESVQNAGYNFNLESDLIVVAKSGELFGVINHISGFPPMPNGMPKLDDCKVTTINAWINTQK